MNTMSKLSRNVALLTVLSAVCAVSMACGSNDVTSDEEVPLLQRLEALDRDITVGDTGDDVTAVHEYLDAYGYLPNDELAAEFPAWRPPVSSGPKSRSRYDANSAKAVRKFQHNWGLDETGVVDEPTRKALGMTRCGRPDNIAPPDPSEKFAILACKWPKTSITWKLVAAGEGLTRAQLESAIQAAANTWTAVTNFTFTKIGSGTADVAVSFADLASGTIGTASTPCDAVSQHFVKLNTDYNWSVDGTPDASNDEFDVETIMLHEFGHTLGINHSSIGDGSTTVMESLQ